MRHHHHHGHAFTITSPHKTSYTTIKSIAPRSISFNPPTTTKPHQTIPPRLYQTTHLSNHTTTPTSNHTHIKPHPHQTTPTSNHTPSNQYNTGKGCGLSSVDCRHSPRPTHHLRHRLHRERLTLDRAQVHQPRGSRQVGLPQSGWSRGAVCQEG